MKTGLRSVGVAVVLLLSASAAFAAPEGNAQQADASDGQLKDTIRREVEVQMQSVQKQGLTTGSGVALGIACVAAGLCTIAGGYAIGRIGAQCIDAIARQPEAAGSMFAPMIISAAMVEGATLFAIVVCLLGVLKI